MDTLKVFQDTLRELMLSNGYASTLQFAKEIDMSDNAIGCWLSGERYPSIDSVIKVADFFGCSSDYLFGLKDTKEFSESKDRSCFIERFDLLRRIQNLTDHALAVACGFESSLIAKWRTKHHVPHILKVIKMTEIFNCSLDFLLGRSDNI